MQHRLQCCACTYSFVVKYSFPIVILISFLPARVADNQYIVFVLPVGLCEWKITNVRPTPTIIFKNVFKTFENEILETFLKEHSALTQKIRR